jgi:hypothetical protein
MEFKSFLREKYYEYREEVAMYKALAMSYEEYVERNGHWLKDMYYAEEDKKSESGGEV